MKLILKFFNKDNILLKTITCQEEINDINNLTNEIYINLFQNFSFKKEKIILRSNFIQSNKILYKLYNSDISSNFYSIEFYADEKLLRKKDIDINLTTYSLSQNLSNANIIIEEIDYYLK